MKNKINMTLANKMVKVVKQAAKRKTGPTQEELIQMAKSLKPEAEVKTSKEAANVLLEQGLLQAAEADLFKDMSKDELIKQLAAVASQSEDFSDYMAGAIDVLPVDDEIKLLLIGATA